jgi:hypothetical protein
MTVFLGQKIGQSLGQAVGQDLCSSDVIARFADATFTNASARMLSYGSASPSVTSFAGGDLATRRIGGKLFAQIELAVENAITECQDFDDDDWTKTRLHAVTPVVANTIVAPDNTVTGDKIVEDDTATATHLIKSSFTPDGSSDYRTSIFAKAGERNWVYLYVGAQGFAAATGRYFNLSTGATGGGTGAAGTYGIEDAGNGWYQCWVGGTSDAAVATDVIVYLADSDNGATYNGDNSSGLYLWNAQVEIGTYLTSPIKTEATALTKACDQAYWASADVPPALRKKITCQWIPEFDSTTAGSWCLFDFEDSGSSERILIRYVGGDDKVEVYNVDTTTVEVESNALTFTRGTKMTVTVDPDNGSIEVSGASAGDGKVTNNSWTTTEGKVWIGMFKTATFQADSLISEPY